MSQPEGHPWKAHITPEGGETTTVVFSVRNLAAERERLEREYPGAQIHLERLPGRARLQQT